ncbi:wnt inhibitory factor 1-like [Lingula anatina]|uniref:Wnt inhibitory factor 1-like n=1 Tax=Lingula anatina TaxID=7574 RepID=A0A1S3K9D8_LINAN|nr:wnt inhibitory factor 1-like [Lingula anatina]|eukprot:XP_013418876.1 wnt inhibitory factor 1-like [Lingula anatina]
MGLLFCPSLALTMMTCVFLIQKQLSQTCECEPDSCYNNGTCEEKADDPSGFQCSCPSDFFGERCELSECQLNNCWNGATCVLNTTNSVSSCICPKGYHGTWCKKAKCGENATCYDTFRFKPLPENNENCDIEFNQRCL